MRPFEPLFRNPHVATIAGNFWTRRLDQQRFPTHEHLFETEPGNRVLVHENRPEGEVRGEVFLQHGLEGSSSSGYIVSLTQALCERGFAVHRVNLRGCGGSEGYTESLYHSGLTHDMRFLVNRLAEQGRGPLFAAGFSLGANLVLKLAGEWGSQAPDAVAGVIGVSTPLDLHACALKLRDKQNLIYEQRFVRSLKQRYLRRHRVSPDRFPVAGLERTRTIIDFDDRFTAQAFGFGSAVNYYQTQSSLGFLSRIQVPALMIQAKDDPMIPFSVFAAPELHGNPHIEFRAVDHGGHLGFIARRPPRFWLDGEITEWIEGIAEQRRPAYRLDSR